MTDYTQLMLAQLAPQFASLNKPRDPYAARRAFGLNVLQQGTSTKPVSGPIEGLARALQAGVGGYFLNRANEDQTAEEQSNAAALSAALKATDKDGNPDVGAITAALARNPNLAPLAAQMQIFNVMQSRDQAQAGARASAITGGGLGPLPGVGGPPGGGQPPAGGGMPTSYYGGISFDESGNNPQARHPLGGAGQYGFMPQTWNGARAAIPGLPDHPTKATPEQQLAAAQWVTRQNYAVMEKALGRPPTGGELRLAHFFGGAGASGLLSLDPNTPFERVPDGVLGMPTRTVIEANPQLRGMTIGALLKDYRGRYDQFNPVGGQPQATPAAAPVAVPPQTAGPIPMQFGGQPQTPALPPRPTQVGAAPPIEGGGVDDNSGGETPPGMQAGFGSPTVKLQPQPRIDDGSQELAAAQRLYALTGDPKAQEQALAYWKMGMDKRMRAQQFQIDLAGKAPPLLGRTDTGGVAHVEGALQTMRDEAAARARGSAVGGGVLQPGTEPNTGAPGMVNPVTNEFKPSPAPFNEDQGKVAGYADRMRNSGGILDRLEQQGTSRRNPALEGVPLGIGREFQDPEWQQFDQARRDFVNAQLRRESGAVISPSEFENAEKQYFPRPGDSPQVIEQKRLNRKLAVEAMVRGAGPAYKPTDPAPVAPAAGNDTLQQARDAIKAGAPRDKVIERLKSMGIDPGGL